MRSVADPWRGIAEWAAQGAAIVLLAWALLLALRTRSEVPRPATAPVDTARLAAWSLAERPASLHAIFDVQPSRLERDWLEAFRRSGIEVSWSGDLPPLAASVEPIASPARSERVRVAAPTGRMVTVSDAAGVLDTARAAGGGIALTARTLTGLVRGEAGSGTASAAVAHRVQIRPVLVLGRASWESKFIVAALEEEGWTVVARLSVAPGAMVHQGNVGAIDTARLAAVIALDASAADDGAGQAIARYARAGGGVVLAGDAPMAAPLRSIAPGGRAAYLAAGSTTIPDSAPRRALSLHPVALQSRDVVVLERRGERAAIAAQRVALGRVVQVGYDETWRWRLGGGENAPAAHAAWWSSIVSAVAYAPREAVNARVVDDLGGARRGDPAPFASLVAALGPATSPPAAVTTIDKGVRWWMMPVIATLLLLAWVSRRMRGAT